MLLLGPAWVGCLSTVTCASFKPARVCASITIGVPPWGGSAPGDPGHDIVICSDSGLPIGRCRTLQCKVLATPRSALPALSLRCGHSAACESEHGQGASTLGQLYTGMHPSEDRVN